MPTFFLACALLGGGVVVLQLVLSLIGLGHDGPHDLHVHAEHAPHASSDGALAGLQLTSLRALSAAVAFFGLAGYGLSSAGASPWLALPVAVVAGAVALFAVALLLRLLLRFESDGVVHLENAMWQAGTVYVPIPGERQGAGKVSMSVQGRLVEYQAVTASEALPTGAPVTVVAVLPPDTLEVVRTPPTPLDEAR
jgi:hypothetical protein